MASTNHNNRIHRKSSRESQDSSTGSNRRSVEFALEALHRKSSRSQDSATRESETSKRSTTVDFLDYFTSTDPSESKLLEVLEENNHNFASMASSRKKPPRGHGGNHHRRRPSKLQQMVKQLSTKKITNWEASADEHPLADSSSNLYNSLSPTENNGGSSMPKKPSPLNAGRRKRSYSVSATSMGDSQHTLGSDPIMGNGSQRRRASLPYRDEIIDRRKPTSEFLSSLSDKLDERQLSTQDSEESDDQPNVSSPTIRTKSPSRGRHRRLRTTTDALYDPHAQHLETLFQMDGGMVYDDPEPTQRPALGPRQLSDLSEDNAPNDDDEEMGNDASRPLLRRQRRQQAEPRQASPWAKAYAYLYALVSFLGPRDIWNGLVYFVKYRVLLVVLPLISVSAFCYYWLDNPTVHFVPGDSTWSWWLLFAARLLLTFGLAEASQYTFEIITTRTSLIVALFGPLAALIAMQSLGWPFLVSSWGSWILILMRGEQPFFKNWLCFTKIEMFDINHNPDGGVLESTIYARILVAMLFVGLATAAKRTAVALYLSRRMLQYYRKQLRDLLADMKMVAEVAELAAETTTEEFHKLIHEESATQDESQKTPSRGSLTLTTLKATSSKMLLQQNTVPTFPTPTKPDDDMLSRVSDDDDEDDDEEDDDFGSDASLEINPSTPTSGRSAFSKRVEDKSYVSSVTGESTTMRGPVQWNELKNQVKPKRQDRVSSPIDMRATAAAVQRQPPSPRRNRMALLERWEEPETKSKKVLPSLFDIFQLRKAMEFMERPEPFSSAFGAARTRKECIRSAARVYRRLLRFTPNNDTLSYEVIGALAYDNDGDLDEKRTQALLKVFSPDKLDMISQLSFLQSVDTVYKHLRFLQASILNSSKIDSVLEDVFDVIFNGLLGIIVMTGLGLNPWPLLVSFSTVMVSFAFSFGPSVAKYIEGTLMIAVRRPYDIGDRITIISGESLAHPASSADSWLVEDITLTTTTLRYAITNEVSTVNNAAIANSRIVNGARSPKAIVTINIKFMAKSTQEKIEVFRIRVENYIFDRPEIWQGLVHFRNDGVDNNAQYAQYLLRVQHKRSWQEESPIMVHKGELENFTNKVAIDLGIVWQSPHHRIRLVEVPPLRQAQDSDDEDNQKDDAAKVEPFMKFMQAEVS